jgi:hypothetical protein
MERLVFGCSFLVGSVCYRPENSVLDDWPGVGCCDAFRARRSLGNVDLIILLTQDTDGMLVETFVNYAVDCTHLLSASSQHEHVRTRWMVAQRCGAPVSQGWTKIGQASLTLCRWLPWRIPMKADLTHHRCEPATPDDNARG